MSADASTMLGITGFTLAAALFWLQYFDLKDAIRPEPRALLVTAFALGVAAALMALGLYGLAAALGLPAGPGATLGGTAFFCFALVGPIEEGTKFLVARAVVFRWREFDEPIDGIVYGCAVALGFATIENLVYAPMLSTVEQIARAVVSPLTHSLWACVWGIGCARALLREQPAWLRRTWQAGTLLLAMALHAAYDYVILGHGATLAASGLTLLVWSYVIWHARHVVRVHARAFPHEAGAGDAADDEVTSDPSGPRRS